MSANESSTLAAIAADVRTGEISIDYALGKAYALGYGAGMSDRHEMQADRIVRVGNGHQPEVQSDAN
jgi:hypothetical protein